MAIQRGSDKLIKYTMCVLFNHKITFENFSSGIYKIVIFHF